MLIDIDMHILQVYFYLITLQNFQPRSILYFLCLLDQIIHEFGLEDKGNWRST